MRKRVAIIAPGYAWLPGEPGTSRFSFLANFLSENGCEVDLIGSTFQHFKKAPRDIEQLKRLNLPYHLIFIPEPGYRKNVDLKRVYSNYIITRNTMKYLNKYRERYDIIYCVIPPNILSAKVGCWCRKNNIPFIVDVEEKLRNIFGTKVNISKGKKKGKIEIEYYNEEDLNNIVSMLLEDN